MAKKKGVIKLSKKALKKWTNILIIILILSVIGFLINGLIQDYRNNMWEKAVNERNIYCNTTWQDYINQEVTGLMTEYNATNCRCFYENQYTMDKLTSLCLCSCELYYLNGTLITNDFRPLFSAINE